MPVETAHETLVRQRSRAGGRLKVHPNNSTYRTFPEISTPACGESRDRESHCCRQNKDHLDSCWLVGALWLVLALPHWIVMWTGFFEAKRRSDATLVELSNGLGGIWEKCYVVVPIAKVTNRHRSSTTAIRRTCDVVFPVTVSIPLEDRLAFRGACSDRTLFAEHTGLEWRISGEFRCRRP